MSVQELSYSVTKFNQSFARDGNKRLSPGKHRHLEEPPTLVLTEVYKVTTTTLVERLTVKGGRERERRKNSYLWSAIVKHFLQMVLYTIKYQDT
jgi:hypothetical protein